MKPRKNESLENVIDRLEKMVTYIEEMNQKDHNPRLFGTYIVEKINDEIEHFRNLKRKASHQVFWPKNVIHKETDSVRRIDNLDEVKKPWWKRIGS